MKTATTRTRPDYYAIAWRLPLIVWQGLFFIGPLIFMVAMSFFLVKNYRMEIAFQFSNWERMLTRGFFWDAYFLTLWLALLATIVTSAVAFPASYFLAFKASENTRRWAIFFLIIPFFTSYLVRIFAWQVILAQQGVINAGLSFLGLGPYQMLNTTLGTMVGYLTLCLPLAVILQTFALANIDKRLVEAAHNLGCGGCAPSSRWWCRSPRRGSWWPPSSASSSPSAISWRPIISADRSPPPCRS
jgi:spermidine/putrescine transport system permease protein